MIILTTRSSSVNGANPNGSGFTRSIVDGQVEVLAAFANTVMEAMEAKTLAEGRFVESINRHVFKLDDLILLDKCVSATGVGGLFPVLDAV